MVQEYRDVFPEILPKGGPEMWDVEHMMKFEPRLRPQNPPPYRLGLADWDKLEIQNTDLLSEGFIHRNSSPYRAPIVLVPKKGGTWRMCIDHCTLHKQTIKDRFPLPKTYSFLVRSNWANVFSELDLTPGCH